jgi:hypothetical protein
MSMYLQRFSDRIIDAKILDDIVTVPRQCHLPATGHLRETFQRIATDEIVNGLHEATVTRLRI